MSTQENIDTDLPPWHLEPAEVAWIRAETQGRRAMADLGLTPVEGATIAATLQDWAGYYGSRLGPEAAVRYTVEGHLKAFIDSHGFPEAMQAARVYVQAHVDQGTDLVTKALTEQGRAAKAEQRRQLAAPHMAQALKAAQGDQFTAALEHLAQAELVDPLATSPGYDRIRSGLQAKLAAAPEPGAARVSVKVAAAGFPAGARMSATPATTSKAAGAGQPPRSAEYGR